MRISYLHITALTLACSLLGVGEAAAQLYRDRSSERGGGTLQTCDTSMHVSIATTLLDNYECVFDPVIIPGSNTVEGMVWSYYNGALEQAYGEPLELYFPWNEAYPVCLTVDAFDLIAQQPCSTTVCDLITPVSSVICTSLVADFGIASIDGQTITFEDLSTYNGTIQNAFWSFGDGTALANATPTNTFSGNGPFEVCLTVTSAQPYYCTSTICQWLYLGPGNVECAELIEQGYGFFQSGSLVGVLDSSRTSGMYSSVDWDFGDGALAHGTIAVHEYNQGEFQLCGTLKAWGPLLADTCVSTLCRTVQSYAVGISDPGSQEQWSVAPNPFNTHLTLNGPVGQPCAVDVLDALGRPVWGTSIRSGAGPLTLDLDHLGSGPYVVRVSTPEGISTLRVVKE